MFDELFTESADIALTARLNRPPEPQAPKFSIWGMLGAAPKGVAAGAAQAIGSTADILGAYGSVMGTTGGSAGGMFSLPTPDEQKQKQEATDKLMTSGPDYMSEGGRSFRNVAASYTPDPVTTHAAESAVFNLFRMGSKAITAAVTMGNIPGAVVAGAEEGFTMSDDLAQQGVDLGTRSEVGAVNAVMNAAAFALPVAGKTWMQTGALALVGGPVSFIAQQAATREILQSADYTKQAEQYDPFDPVGLALSTVIPLGFGALAMRGMKARAGESVPEAAPVAHAPEEVVDAARVSLVRQHMDAANPVPGDLAASDAHVKAYTQAMDQMAAGERVKVDDVAPSGAAIDDFGVGLKQALDESAVKPAENQPLSLDEQAPTATEPVAPKSPDAAQPTPTESRLNDIEAFNPAALATEASRLLSDGRSPAEVIGNLEASGAKVSPELQNMLIGASEFGGRINELVAQVDALKSQRGPAEQPFDAIAQAVENMRQGIEPAPAKPSNPLETRLAEMAVRNPTALAAEIAVEFDDAGKPTRSMKASEWLDMVKQEAAQDASDASLLEVAANCFLTGAI